MNCRKRFGVFVVRYVGTERCTFEVKHHTGLRDKLQSILEENFDLTVQSCGVCRPCGRQTESLDKRNSVIIQQITEASSVQNTLQ